MSRQHIRLASLFKSNPINFVNYFDDPIILPPHTTVALKQCKFNADAWEVNTEGIDVNQYLSWELTGLPPTDATRSQFYGHKQGDTPQTRALFLMSSVMPEDADGDAVVNAVLEETNPLNFIPLHNNHPIVINSLGINVRNQKGGLVDWTQTDYTDFTDDDASFYYLVFDVECPKFSMRDLANLLQPKEDVVVAEQTEITKDILGK